MLRNMMKSKIHRATVTQADLHYNGSITIDKTLMDAADLLPYERVQVLDVNNGNRLETYVIEGDADSGVIGINGAAARLVHEGDTVIIIAYGLVSGDDAKRMNPTVIHVDRFNRIVPPPALTGDERLSLTTDDKD